jgi:hypothetical protein
MGDPHLPQNLFCAYQFISWKAASAAQATSGWSMARIKFMSLYSKPGGIVVGLSRIKKQEASLSVNRNVAAWTGRPGKSFCCGSSSCPPSVLTSS